MGGCPPLVGSHWLSIGGGNSLGKFTSTALNTIISEMGHVKTGGYSGIVFDAEHIVGSSSTMIPLRPTRAWSGEEVTDMSRPIHD